MSAGTDVGSVFALLYAGHMVGDHWIQTNAQALTKGRPGWVGRLACARHVTTLTATKAAFLTALALVTGWHPHLVALIVALVVDALSHYWADRRTTLAGLAGLVERVGINGKTTFYALGSPRLGRDDNPSLGTGAYALDASWHIGWLAVAALISSL